MVDFEVFITSNVDRASNLDMAEKISGITAGLGAMPEHADPAASAIHADATRVEAADAEATHADAGDAGAPHAEAARAGITPHAHIDAEALHADAGGATATPH